MVLQTKIAHQLKTNIASFHERIHLSDGQRTTLHVVRYTRASVKPRWVVFKDLTLLLDWCKQNGKNEAVSGNYFLRSSDRLLGEVWLNGRKFDSIGFDKGWGGRRGSVYAPTNGDLQLAPRHKLPAVPAGDLLEIGPTLVHQGVSLFTLHRDPEGFSSTAYQHDEDINCKRHPRLAIGSNTEYIWTVSVDGRGPADAGMYLQELADVFLALGASEAVNLDGGSSSTQITGGKLLNRPRTNLGESSVGFPVHSALIFD